MQKTMTQFSNLLALVVFAVLLRLMPHPANIAPIAAMALFGGAYLNKKYALVVPLIAMIVSDFFIGFHDTMLFVYVSFALTGCIGVWLRTHKTVPHTILASLSSSILFFIVTNFGVWAVGSMYAKTPAGLLECYTFALPFFRNTIVGDLVYTGVFFGGYFLVQKFLSQQKQFAYKTNR